MVLTCAPLCRELGLDELLRHCERVVEKLRHPEMDPCYQAMAGTALFTHTAFDMLRNHSRYCGFLPRPQKSSALKRDAAQCQPEFDQGFVDSRIFVNLP